MEKDDATLRQKWWPFGSQKLGAVALCLLVHASLFVALGIFIIRPAGSIGEVDGFPITATLGQVGGGLRRHFQLAFARIHVAPGHFAPCCRLLTSKDWDQFQFLQKRSNEGSSASCGQFHPFPFNFHQISPGHSGSQDDSWHPRLHNLHPCRLGMAPPRHQCSHWSGRAHPRNQCSGTCRSPTSSLPPDDKPGTQWLNDSSGLRTVKLSSDMICSKNIRKNHCDQSGWHAPSST